MGRSYSLLMATVVLMGAPALDAQEVLVTGDVRGTADGRPLVGVYVALVDASADTTTTAVLSNEAGRFVLSAGPGTYRLVAERVGLARFSTAEFVLGDAPMDLNVSMAEQAIALSGLTVQTPVRLCALDAQNGQMVQAWWEESRKALQAADLVHRQGGVGYRVERFRREWSADLRRLRGEEVLPPDSTLQVPFRSPSPDTLVALGFVRGERGERQFFGPDPAVLVARPFLDRHCFEPERSVETGTLALRVRPAGDVDVPDIAGTLVVDTISGQLRSFEFNYVGLPDDLRIGRDSGGYLEFEYLESGAWIVSQWWIRMPLIDPRVWPRRVLAYVDEGGRVEEAPSVLAESQPEPFGVATPPLATDSDRQPQLVDSVQPAFELEPIEVSVTGARIVDGLRLALGVDPRALFGFRLIEGVRLEEAKRNGSMDPTEVLRWLSIPVAHAGPCVYINVVPSTVDSRNTGGGDDEPFCGNLLLDDELVPNEQLDSVKLDDVFVIMLLPGQVRMYTEAYARGR